jgi:hypothetical protein
LWGTDLTDQRPKTVPLVAAFLFVATIVAGIVGIALLFRSPLQDRLWELNKPAEAVFRKLGRISGALLLVLATGTLFAGVGLLRRRPSAWWFALVLFAIDGCGDLVNFVMTGDLLRSASGVLISAAFLYALTRASVRRYFSRD